MIRRKPRCQPSRRSGCRRSRSSATSAAASASRRCDLEIRGAGNLLGGEQSGPIDAVGFEMAREAAGGNDLGELKGEDLEDDLRATVNLKVDFRIDEGYIGDINQRLMMYRRIAAARTEEDLEQVLAEVRDRCTARRPSPSSTWPIMGGSASWRTRSAGRKAIDRDSPLVVFKFQEKAKVDPVRLIKMVRERDDIQLIPPSGLKLDLTKDGRKSGSGPARPRRQPAWWTARATASRGVTGLLQGRDSEAGRRGSAGPGRGAGEGHRVVAGLSGGER